jgi:membrane protein YdbS with pleckstrin-like domain
MNKPEDKLRVPEDISIAYQVIVSVLALMLSVVTLLVLSFYWPANMSVVVFVCGVLAAIWILTDVLRVVFYILPSLFKQDNK